MVVSVSKKQDDGSKKPLSFLKRGADAKQTIASAEEKAKLRGIQRANRFWVKEGNTAVLTFLDGELDSDGVLFLPVYYEHNVQLNGKWGNFYACTQDNEPCPICEGGASAALVGLVTVIDHSEYTDKQGVVHKDQVRLFAAKRETMKQLQMMATKRGGLRGCSFDVARTGDKSASVGNVFDFNGKLTEQQLVAKFGDKAVPMDYDTALASINYPAKELRKMGFGSMKGPVGSESDDDGVDYSKNL